MGKRLGGDPSRGADLNWPKGYCPPYNVNFKNKTWGRGRRMLGLLSSGVAATGRLAGSAGGRWWVIASASFVIYLFIFFILNSWTVFILDPLIFLAFFFWFSPPARNEQVTGWGLSCWKRSTHHSPFLAPNMGHWVFKITIDNKQVKIKLLKDVG